MTQGGGYIGGSPTFPPRPIRPNIPIQPEFAIQSESLQFKIEYEEIRKLMDAENSPITQIYELKEEGGYSVAEIAEQLYIVPKNIYYYLSRAKAIGQKYHRES